MIFIFTVVGGMVFSPLFDQQIFALEGVSDKVKKLCENKYESYKKIGEDLLKDTNSQSSYLSDCVLLYKDPAWDFKGKEKIDNYYDKNNQISSIVNPSLNNYENQKLEIKNTSSIKIGFQNYALKMRICSDDKVISEPKFFVVTDKEYFLAKSSRILKENSCNFVMIYANLQDPGKIILIPFDGNYMPSKYLKVKSIY